MITLDKCEIRDNVYAKLVALKSYIEMNAYTLIISLLLISELIVLIEDGKHNSVVAV